jgi:polyhydroxyalkanoate synthesis regulator phasin
MNDKLKRFTELCCNSRKNGLTMEQHLEKRKLADELVTEGVMTYDGCYDFVNEEDSKFFQEMIDATK